MYKIKSTKKEVKEASYRVLSIGYCEAQYLLKGESPVCYCCGNYGWYCDNYDMAKYGYNLTISTGYSPVGDQNICKETLKNKYNIIKKYDDKAKKINSSCGDWQETQKKLQKNLIAFIKEVLKNEE